MQYLRRRIGQIVDLRQALHDELQRQKGEYVRRCKEEGIEQMLYITDHALIRYAQRKKKWDVEAIGDIPNIKRLRLEILKDLDKLGQDKIIRLGMNRVIIDDLIYIVQGVTVITVYVNEEVEDDTI